MHSIPRAPVPGQAQHTLPQNQGTGAGSPGGTAPQPPIPPPNNNSTSNQTNAQNAQGGTGDRCEPPVRITVLGRQVQMARPLYDAVRALRGASHVTSAQIRTIGNLVAVVRQGTTLTLSNFARAATDVSHYFGMSVAVSQEFNRQLIIAAGLAIPIPEHVRRVQTVVGFIVVGGLMIYGVWLVGSALAGAGAGGAAITAGSGFTTFAKFKEFFRVGTSGNQLHHIVEQSQIAKSGFDPTRIHNIGNIVEVTRLDHIEISRYYSKIHAFTNGLRFRDWLAAQNFTFEKQFQMGLEVMRELGITWRTPIPR